MKLGLVSSTYALSLSVWTDGIGILKLVVQLQTSYFSVSLEQISSNEEYLGC
jgi:hypothetical protein